MIYALGERRPSFIGGAHFVAPDASIIGSVELNDAVSVWFGAVLRGDNDWIRIGSESNVQDGAILHTDPGIELTLGARVTVGHRAMLHGCTIGEQTLIGIGTTVLNRASIGANSIVGAHSLVTEGKSFPDGVLLMGAPARVVRELNDEEQAALGSSAETYVTHARRYRKDLGSVEPTGAA